NCQKACKKCDEGRPCTRCIKYGLTDTCVDSTRKVRKKGVKRGPYKRRPPPTQIGSASASTTPTLSHAVLATGAGAGPAGYMSEPVTALSSPTQSHMLPFTTSSSSSGMGHLSGQLDFGYDTSGGHGSSSNGGAGGYASFQSSRMENTYTPAYTTSYSGPGLYASYGMTSSNGGHQNAIACVWVLATLVDARARSEHKESSHHAHRNNDVETKAHHNHRLSEQRGLQQRQGHHHHSTSEKAKKTDKKPKKNKNGGKSDQKKTNRHKKGSEKKKKSNKKNKENKKKGAGKHKPKIEEIHSMGISDVSCGPGLDVIRCPEERPCCSQWGYCGDDPDYCAAGCQSAFGQCWLNTKESQTLAPASSKHKHQHNKQKKNVAARHHGFDLKERQRSMPNQDGRRFRIASDVPKLPPNGTLVNVAYFPGWTQYRGQGRNNCRQRPYLPSAIPWSSLDYVIFAFVYFDEEYQLYPADPSDEALYFQMNQLKLPTNTRVMISIGGWSFTHPESHRDEDTRHLFEGMIATPESRKAFIESCIGFCQFYGFDGVDIDYEYPIYRDRDLITALFQEMRSAFDAEGTGLVLSLAGASFADGIQGFDFEKVSAVTDFVMIMAYDLYGSYDSTHLVNIHTALVQMPTENHSGHSVQGAVELYLDRGVPRQKIVLGLALYGNTFLLSDTRQQEPGRAMFTTGGDPTSCIGTRGDMAYNEISGLLHPTNNQQPAVIPLWDPDAKAFYFVYGNRGDNWVGYDDRPSLDLKLQLVTEADLAGVMWWSLDQDLDRTSEEDALFTKPQRERGGQKQKKKKNKKKYGHKNKKLQPRAIHQIPFEAPRLGDGQEPVKPAAILPIYAPSQPPFTPSMLTVDAVVVPVAGTVDQKDAIVTSANTGVSTSTDAPSPGPSSQAPEDKLVEPSIPTTCPVIYTAPAALSSISQDILGRPGLVPYVALKKKRCSVVVEYPHVLPETPLGNTVMTRCPGPDHCSESWQAYTCTTTGWSSGSPCYARAQLSPSLYFYGELDLIRVSARDRDIKDKDEVNGSAPSSSKLSTQIGSRRPEYIEHYLKNNKLKAPMTTKAEREDKKKKNKDKKNTRG
ncbi:hypothetical protein BGZ83_001765, partial [Gryganskiella cystojenkinii]